MKLIWVCLFFYVLSVVIALFVSVSCEEATPMLLLENVVGTVLVVHLNFNNRVNVVMVKTLQELA